jgi:hypothetical protein
MFEEDVGLDYFFDWCLECIEIAYAREIDHVPEGDVAEAIAERLQESGVVLECLRLALIPEKLEYRLADPDRVAAELKYCARQAFSDRFRSEGCE